MKLTQILDLEPLQETMKYINEHRAWDMVNQCYRFEGECKANVADAQIYQRGEYLIVEHNSIVHYWEYLGNYCHLMTALNVMDIEKPAKWKTVARLITLRQAIRENTAQGMGLEDMIYYNDLTLKGYNDFITTARVFDKRHHGQVTF